MIELLWESTTFSDCFRGFPEPEKCHFLLVPTGILEFGTYENILYQGNPKPSFLRVMTHTLRAKNPSFFMVLGSKGRYKVFRKDSCNKNHQVVSRDFFAGHIQQLTAEGLIFVKLPHTSQNNVPNNPCPFCAQNNNYLNDGIPTSEIEHRWSRSEFLQV